MNEEQLRQRLSRLADHARTAPATRLHQVHEPTPTSVWPRWAAVGAIAVAAAVVAAVAFFPRSHDRSPQVVQSGSLAPSTTKAPPTTATKPATTTTIKPGLDPPEATGPAAGVCSQAQGSTGNVTIGPDMVPQPRCLVIRHDQSLSVTNNTGKAVTPTLGTHFKLSMAPGQILTFPAPVGTYLAPGDHRLIFSASSAGDIWVDAVCRSPGTVDCTNP